MKNICRSIAKGLGISNLYNVFANYYAVRKADFFIISPPKAGRTWVRFLLARIISEQYNIPYFLDLNKMRQLKSNLPKIIFSHSGSAFHKKKDVEVINFKKYKNKNVILLVRDPRDVILSYYYQVSTREGKYKGDLSSFIRDKKMGIEPQINFLNNFLKNKNLTKDFLLIKYENLRENTKKEITKILKFLTLNDVSQEIIDEAIEYSKFENMKKMESKNIFTDTRLMAVDIQDQNSYKVRKGKVGGYKDEFNDEDIKYLNNIVEKLDPFFGY